jgi:tripartite-type tricarboxylate transporter receptor subunit TctC
MHGSRVRTLAVVMTLTLMPAAATAQTGSEFRTISIVVGSSAGGGYDTYARILARHIGRYIPGQPNIIVQNMPGASSLKAVQYLDSSAPKDGSVMAAFNPGLLNESLLNADKIRFKFTDAAWVGSITRDLRTCTPGPRPASRLLTTCGDTNNSTSARRRRAHPRTSMRRCSRTCSASRSVM